MASPTPTSRKAPLGDIIHKRLRKRAPNRIGDRTTPHCNTVSFLNALTPAGRAQVALCRKGPVDAETYMLGFRTRHVVLRSGLPLRVARTEVSAKPLRIWRALPGTATLAMFDAGLQLNSSGDLG